MKMTARKPEGEKKQTDWGRISRSVERLSGVSLHDVTVHYNSPKPSRLQALAYTRGTNIYLGPGQEHHLEHEAGHAAQQKQGRVNPDTLIDGEPANTNAGLENEAQTMARKVHGTLPQSFPHNTPATAGASMGGGSGVVQRMPKHEDNWQKRLADFKASVSGKLSGPDIATEAAMYANALAAAKTLDSKNVPNPGVDPEIHALPQPLEDYITWVKSKTGKSAELESTIRWQPTWHGLGTEMEAYLRPGTIPVGSMPSFKFEGNGVWDDLANRGGSNKTMTMYVMGHMLNDNIGGPGLAYNLTPLIGKNKKGGADDSNALHLSMVETDVKDACDEMNKPGSGIAYVYYYVKADYGRPPRSKQIGILNNVLNDYTAIATSDSSATHNNVKKDLEKAGLIDKNDLKKACNAISTGPATKAKQVIPKMNNNIDLWKTEDKYVPQQLICQWGTHDGTNWIKQVAKNVPVSLPDDISVPYKGP